MKPYVESLFKYQRSLDCYMLLGNDCYYRSKASSLMLLEDFPAFITCLPINWLAMFRPASGQSFPFGTTTNNQNRKKVMTTLLLLSILVLSCQHQFALVFTLRPLYIELLAAAATFMQNQFVDNKFNMNSHSTQSTFYYYNFRLFFQANSSNNFDQK